MKYQNGKLKIEHHYLEEFEDFFIFLTKLPEVIRIIPGRISRQQKGTSARNITISYNTKTGIKLKLKKGGTSQEVFVICEVKDINTLKEKINFLQNK